MHGFRFKTGSSYQKKERLHSRVLSDLLCVFTLFTFLDSWGSAGVADLRRQSLPGCRLTRETERRSRTKVGAVLLGGCIMSTEHTETKWTEEPVCTVSPSVCLGLLPFSENQSTRPSYFSIYQQLHHSLRTYFTSEYFSKVNQLGCSELNYATQ